MKQWMAWLAAILLCLLASVAWRQGVPAVAQAVDTLQTATTTAKIDQAVQQALATIQPDAMITVIVTLNVRADLTGIRDRTRSARLKRVIQALRDKAARTQDPLRQLLQTRRNQGKVSAIQPYWIFNGLSVTATPAVIGELAALTIVESITPNTILLAPAMVQSQGTGMNEPNLTLVNAPALWALGWRGQGIVVANFDTGVDVTHPDLAGKWRGGSNSWFDPYGEQTTPTDLAGNSSGHGTWTMGVMVGGPVGGTAVGMAPDAQWIAAKIFNNQGAATVAGIHAAFQWVLDPDGNPVTDDAPHVVNHSWTFQNPGCNLEFQNDLLALRAAGILPIFAAGNGGPNVGTSISPSNNPEAFAVGAVNNSDQIYTYSSRGPANCGEGTGIFPELVAPGVSIRSTDLYGFYLQTTGTSLAAPHAAGALALLLGAYPNLTAEEQATALLQGTVDLGVAGPDQDFGYGRLDVLRSYQALTPPPVNQPPMVSASSPQTITLPAVALLDGTATDDGLPDPPHQLTTTWSLVSGPAVVSFGDGSAVDTTATFSVPGEYLLHLTANDGALSATANVRITVNPAPPTLELIYVSLSSNGNVGGVRFQDEDILAYNLITAQWALLFDGSLVGIMDDVDAFAVQNDGSLLLSLDKEASTLPGLPTGADDSDIIRFTPAIPGDYSTGDFSLFFDGSLYGLTTNGEDVDTIALTLDGRLLISTLGNYSVPAEPTGKLTGPDEDLLLFNPVNGRWQHYFAGATFGLTASSEDVWSASLVADQLYLTTQGAFTVTNVSGNGSDIFICTATPSTLTTPITHCSFAPFWNGSAHGLGNKIMDGLEISAPASMAAAVKQRLHVITTAVSTDKRNAGENALPPRSFLPFILAAPEADDDPLNGDSEELDVLVEEGKAQ